MPHDEWLQPDGLGGFASGTREGVRTRRYHALLLCAQTPPTGRTVLVNGLETWVETPAGRFALSTQCYTPGVLHPDGARFITSFRPDPWPTWLFRLDDGTEIEQQILGAHGSASVAVSWRLLRGEPATHLFVRPLLSGRDLHALHHENATFRFAAEVAADTVSFRPYEPLPAVHCQTNGEYMHEPVWYRDFLYVDERERGLDATEDLGAPGVFSFALDREAVLVLSAGTPLAPAAPPHATLAGMRHAALQRWQRHATPLRRAADAYLVKRGTGTSIIAGYPWFSDWGRDTFIAVRGLCIAAGRLDVATDILLAWCDTVSEGMLPNYFPEGAATAEYNSVDASLWFVIAAGELLQGAARARQPLRADVRDRLIAAVAEILRGYSRGTRHGIRPDGDGLLCAGEPGVQLTWMDAKIGDWVVTPRVGKPVEVQALWLNALRLGALLTGSRELRARFVLGRTTFEHRFWNDAAGCLHDVVDVDGVSGTTDSSMRPNQIFAVGGLPVPVLSRERAWRVVDRVERELWTPAGLRSLSPRAAQYVGRYEGGVLERDGSYHQGTVWPWLTGPFVEAWVRVRGSTTAAKRQAHARFVQPLLAHLDEAGLGHVSEIADGDAPHTPRGCPFQAWSIGELLRIEELLRNEHASVHAAPAALSATGG